MSVEQEVDDLVRVAPTEAQSQHEDPVVEAVESAVNEVAKLLRKTDYSFLEICTEVEHATSRNDCRQAFRHFNKVVRMILLAAPGGEHDHIVKDAICALEPSEQFRTLVEEHASVSAAITAYKKMVLQSLAATLHDQETTVSVSDVQDDALFDEFLSKPSVNLPAQSAQVPVIPPAVHPPEAQLSRKRGISVLAAEPLPAVFPKKKKSSIPALASLSSVSDMGDASGQTKKRTL